jgi:hypothetical protein
MEDKTSLVQRGVQKKKKKKMTQVVLRILTSIHSAEGGAYDHPRLFSFFQ